MRRKVRDQSSLLGLGYYVQKWLIYRRWVPPNQDEDMAVEQIVLPTQSRATILKLAHFIPWMDTWERPRLLAKSCSGFTGPPCSKMWEPIVRAVPSARKHHMGESIHTFYSYGPLPRSRRGHLYILTLCNYATWTLNHGHYVP